jgi:hypothetical protein
MSQCRTCRNNFNSLTFSQDLLAFAPVPPPGPDFTARTVQVAFRAGEIRSRRWKYQSWCLAGLMVLFSTFLVLGWAAVMGPVARLGLRGLLGIFLDVVALITVAGKFQAVLAELISLMRDATVTVALGVGAPVFLGCLVVLCLMLFIFARPGFSLPGGLVKRR